MARLQDKVAIVTGASKGIGASIARHLADAGAAVVVNYASSKAGADRVVADITRALREEEAEALGGRIGRSQAVACRTP